ncbi:hypothetical protein OESDEN_14668 [Oesophagostomum dentatum]|uniref:CC2D2A N-terminal C2 domain-containing protein n=1 Tax=Oesophagostomum dentatum TaxID=61180 RepID=A0A0B1SNZ5_OESDE|nr:hypothetical protein OESDEN_14668 [Oesophagostomum dentatum]
MRSKLRKQEGPTEGELQSVDEQIEQSLKIGARFLQEQASLNPPDDVQRAFFVEDYDKEPQPAVAGPKMEYRRAEVVEEDDQGQITYYDPRPSDLETNRQMTSSIMEQRLSPAFFANGRLRVIDDSQFVKPLKIMQREEVSHNYVRAEPWETFVDEIRGSDYVQLDILLDAVTFEQHPLCGEEDKIVMRLRTLYDEQVQRINKMTDTLVNIENLPAGQMTSSVMEQRLSPAFFANGRLRVIDDSQFVKPLKIMQREEVSHNYVRAEPWETFVDEIRGSDYVQLDILLDAVTFEQHPLCGEEDKIVMRLRTLYDEQVQRINEMTDTLVNIENLPAGENPSALREHVDLLYRDIRRAAEGLLRDSLLGKLIMDSPVTPIGALPQAEKTRIDSLKKKSIVVTLHFNEMFVCKTKTLPLEGFQYRLEQIYNLEIVSEPKTITATVVEKTGTTKKTLATVRLAYCL